MEEKIKILAVDDEKFNLRLLKGCLNSDTYEITGCSNAVDALQEFKKQYFDVLLLDVLMPGIDGFELRKLIRGLDQERPIIFLTSLVDDVNATMLNQISWDPYTYYMNKSFSKKMLSSKIDEAVSIHRGRKLVTAYSRKLESEMALAGDLQKILLPNWCEFDEKMITSSLYLPSGKVSGDIFEIFPITPGKYLLFIGDIAGHGIQAALYMSAIQSFLKVAVTGSQLEPHPLLNQLNTFFCNELDSSTYMTCLAAMVDFSDNTIHWHSAGHPGLLCCSQLHDEVTQLGNNRQGGIPIGWFPDTEYLPEDTQEGTFADDTILLALTDGIYDVYGQSPDDTPDPAAFLEIVGELSSNSDALTLPFRLAKALDQIGYENHPDDICLVTLQKRLADPRLHEIIIPAEISMVSKVAIQFGDQIFRSTSDLKLQTKIELLIHEYLNNVIIHGYSNRKNSKNRIYLSLRLQDHELQLRGLDRGKFWDFNETAVDQEKVENGASSSTSPGTSGRGLQIFRDITNHISRNSYCGLNETVFYVKF